jgi:transposase
MAHELSSARQSENPTRESMWVNELRQRRGYNRATVAVANKNARVIWAVLTSGEPYRPAA